ncbi:hypothetical protein [Winogradskyella sp. KYW1333]|jgi:hypothetical protein|uniref:hypothetical protein n=1 Tax=Winogradskyella sp. KYW1333 TaxID=2282123 RepID=UPI000DF46A7F|nr:hypothetical protein [Winogradskyella sp. KYW1333]RCT53787.1 hypothetical protein DUZ96_11365 [Winogradskyella sp. KYW1333]
MYFKAFLFLFSPHLIIAQNTSIKQIRADHIKEIFVDGNQLFLIDVKTSRSNIISINSIVDGEYENEYQIFTSINGDRLDIKLEQIAFREIADDKRNALKVIAAKLLLEIPQKKNLSIESDIGSVILNGSFNSISIQLQQGYCNLKGNTKEALINTIDGNINIQTGDAKIVSAVTNNGKVNIYPFKVKSSLYNLKSINGDISIKMYQ